MPRMGISYCIDDAKRTVWMTAASTGHSEATKWTGPVNEWTKRHDDNRGRVPVGNCER